MLDGKRILLIVSGGIAAYKGLDLIRRLRERGAAVRWPLAIGGFAMGEIVVTKLQTASGSNSNVSKIVISLVTAMNPWAVSLP